MCMGQYRYTCTKCGVAFNGPIGNGNLCDRCRKQTKYTQPIDQAEIQNVVDAVGKKYDQDKRDWTLLPFDALEEIVKVLEHGVKKYDRDNWKKVEPFTTRYINAAFRHLIAYAKGEEKDPETRLSHIAHLGCNVLFLLWMEKNGTKEPESCSNCNGKHYCQKESDYSGAECKGSSKCGLVLEVLKHIDKCPCNRSQTSDTCRGVLYSYECIDWHLYHGEGY